MRKDKKLFKDVKVLLELVATNITSCCHLQFRVKSCFNLILFLFSGFFFSLVEVFRGVLVSWGYNHVLETSQQLFNVYNVEV